MAPTSLTHLKEELVVVVVERPLPLLAPAAHAALEHADLLHLVAALDPAARRGGAGGPARL